ncbi:MAG TPA: response regulator [Opitutaceae bacterium]|nr:response regulator [Opitutaceae bacterium]
MPLKILVVDDDPVSRRLLRQILAATEPGCHVVEASSGTAACRMLEQPGHDIDLTFLDISMPDFSGFDVLQRLRAIRLANAPSVIFCSSANDRPTVLKAAAAGARHFIVKPPSAAVVAEKIRQVQAVRLAADGPTRESMDAAPAAVL